MQFSANTSLGISLLEKKYYFHIKMFFLWYFTQIKLKKWDQCLCDRVLGTKSLQVPFQIGSLLSGLLCADSSGVSRKLLLGGAR